ncbi:hypothetical protein SPRG_12121 [Saprolegnia parasitica CBS 223.65]|uniref:Uncharacterized protein n=1 Tax=Saprolegnia parasitica (strain CBS 223.65) TaxID=695850 RepID=A0A067C664_SAPPC|nr:hypothetical protein SPRG_12121 [Saprolegnia parasitica CBS 223.65]KDO22282.1 hypothetical protein SPRG_12121 [Saprolegnia parasitica CBS 223.65]|eukprot:XP_012207017.1 hypothetical protein SPRG_12121 [Saprolegnia parasitica CBS 223.65]
MAVRVLAAVAIAAACVHGQSWPPANQCSATGFATWATQCPSLLATNAPTKVTQPQTGSLKATNLSTLDTLDQARVVLQGRSAVQAMDGLRSESASWYNTSLTNMMIAFCHLTSTAADLTRCVPNTSTNAARDRNNACIVVPGNGSCAALPGQCERLANCLWPTPNPNISPRQPRFSQAQIDTALSWIQETYAESLVPYAAPGVTLAVLTFFGFVGFFVLRCVCNKCGGRDPIERGYTWCAVLIPGVSFFLFSLAIFICSVAAYIQNNSVTARMHDLFASLNEVLANAQIYAKNLLTPLNAIETSQATTVAAMKGALGSTDWIVSGAKALQTMGAAIDSTYTTAFPTTCVDSDKVCLTCPAALCGTATVQARAITAAMATTASQLDATFQLARATMYDGSATLFNAINTAQFNLDVLASATNNSNAAVSTVQTSFDEISYGRSGLVLCIFILGLFVSLLGMIGFARGVCKNNSKMVHLLHVSWILGVLLCIISFVVASLLIAVSALWYDGCKYLDMIVTNMAPYFSAETSSILTSCIQGTSTLAALQMTPAYTASCGLFERLSVAQSVAPLTTFQQLQNNPITVYGLSDFGYSADIQASLLSEALRDMPPQKVTATNVGQLETPWELYETTLASADCKADDADPAMCFMLKKCNAGSSCLVAFQDARIYAKAAVKIQSNLYMMNQDYQGNTNYNNSKGWPGGSQSLLNAGLSYATKLNAFVTTQLPPLTKLSVWSQINAVECTSNEGCSWINQEYAIVHDLLCQDLLGLCLNIALCVFLVALFLLPLAVCGILLQKRLRGIRGATLLRI